MIMIGRMAEKYHKLPHEIEQQATTYDLMIWDVLLSYDNYQQQKSSGAGMDPGVYGLGEQQLLAMVEKCNNE